MKNTQKKNQKVPTFSKLASSANKLKREVSSLECMLKEEHQANAYLLVELSKYNSKFYRVKSKLALSISINAALIGLVIIILGVQYV